MTKSKHEITDNVHQLDISIDNKTEIKQNDPVKLSIQTRLEMSKGKSLNHRWRRSWVGLQRKANKFWTCVKLKLKLPQQKPITSVPMQPWIVPSSATQIKIRGRTTRPTKDNVNANMPKIKSKALGFRRPSKQEKTEPREMDEQKSRPT